MFGYVTVNQDELKIKDYNFYHSCYCGLCRTLKKRHGLVAPLTLSYDMTFLVILLSALYEEPFKESKSRCIVHPTRRHKTRRNQWSDYAADMTILLAYHNLMDDWVDDKQVVKLATAKALEKAYRKIAVLYPRQTAAVEKYMADTNQCERENSKDIDKVAGLTGTVLGEFFVKNEDIWAPTLRKVGFFLGKYIYLMDAYEDLDDDKKKKNYNVFASISSRCDYAAIVENMLVMMMSECSKEFEKLPILQYVDILRNILYSGVWVKYELLKKKK